MTYKLKEGFDIPKESFREVKIPKQVFIIQHLETGQTMQIKGDQNSELPLRKCLPKFSKKEGKFEVRYMDPGGFRAFDVYEVEYIDHLCAYQTTFLSKFSGHIIDGLIIMTWSDRDLINLWRKGLLVHRIRDF